MWLAIVHPALFLTGVVGTLCGVLAACSGPRPQAEVLAISPSPQPGHERVTVGVRNEGPGHGEVEIEIILTSPRGIRFRETHTVELEQEERIQLAVDIAAPPDTYVATVEAKYPD